MGGNCSAVVMPTATPDSSDRSVRTNQDVTALNGRARADLILNKTLNPDREVELRDGRRHSCEIGQALGHPVRPMSDERLHAKFIDCAGRAALPMGAAEARTLLSRLTRLEQEPNLAKLF